MDNENETERSNELSVPNALNFEDLSSSIAGEIAGMRAMDNVMGRIEAMLFDPDFLHNCKTEELCELYNLALKRKSVSHNFIFKMIDVGLKTSLLNRMFNIETEVKADPNIIPASSSKELIEAKEIVKGILDSRLKAGVDVENVLENDELTPGAE